VGHREVGGREASTFTHVRSRAARDQGVFALDPGREVADRRLFRELESRIGERGGLLYLGGWARFLRTFTTSDGNLVIDAYKSRAQISYVCLVILARQNRARCLPENRRSGGMTAEKSIHYVHEVMYRYTSSSCGNVCSPSPPNCRDTLKRRMGIFWTARSSCRAVTGYFDSPHRRYFPASNLGSGAADIGVGSPLYRLPRGKPRCYRHPPYFPHQGM
jgi:hypothetical protein